MQIGETFMRKFTAFVLMVALVLSLTGCGRNDPYRTDTVIYIPADPTTEATEPAPVAKEAEPETTETTPRATISFFSSYAEENEKNNEASKKSSTGSSNKTSTKETEAPVTVPFPAAPDPAETECQIYDISDYAVGFMEISMMNQVNSLRLEAGLPELQMSDRLSAIASVRAYEACLCWSHTRPDGSDYTTVFGDYGFSAGAVGENLLYTSGGEDGPTLVSKWMAAETNRDNLMYEGFTTMGIGLYKANGYLYIACLLAG